MGGDLETVAELRAPTCVSIATKGESGSEEQKQTLLAQLGTDELAATTLFQPQSVTKTADQ